MEKIEKRKKGSRWQDLNHDLLREKESTYH
jgi:hypothetical protein